MNKGFSRVLGLEYLVDFCVKNTVVLSILKKPLTIIRVSKQASKAVDTNEKKEARSYKVSCNDITTIVAQTVDLDLNGFPFVLYNILTSCTESSVLT